MVSTRQRGFTLPELMAVLAIMAILGAMAAPAYTSWMASVRASGAATDLHTALNHARSEAIKRNAEITLEPADDGWQAGWHIAAPGDADRLLLDHSSTMHIDVEGPTSVTYLPNGRTKGANLPRFEVSADISDLHYCVAVDLSGRPRQTKSSC
jgi:type IV fimbrial biogenesis protein FimT